MYSGASTDLPIYNTVSCGIKHVGVVGRRLDAGDSKHMEEQRNSNSLQCSSSVQYVLFTLDASSGKEGISPKHKTGRLDKSSQKLGPRVGIYAQNIEEIQFRRLRCKLATI